MSKSLKNFISIREYLNEGSDRAKLFRIFCLMNRYANPVEYSSDRIQDARTVDRKLMDFFTTSENVIKVLEKKNPPKKWSSTDLGLFQK